MRRLIVNADDFGLLPAVNRGIVLGHTQGCITSTSLMAGGAAFEEAVTQASNYPPLGVGVHLTLVAERPVTDPGRVSSLVDRDGRLISRYPEFMARFVQGRVVLAEVRTELEAQIAKVAATGLKITHLDSHQHLHVLPGVIDIVLDLAVQFGIRGLRIPAEPARFIGGYPYTIGRLVSRFGLSALAAIAKRKARRRGLTVPDHFFGMLAGGNLRQDYLLNIIDSLPPGVSEIMTHPGDDDAALAAAYGWRYNWQAELAAVCSGEVWRRLTELNIQLVSFRELDNG